MNTIPTTSPKKSVSIRVHPWPFSSLFCVSCFVLGAFSAALPAAAEPPASQPAAWGEAVNHLQARLSPSGPAAVSTTIPLTAELKNLDTAPTPEKIIRVWFMITQGDKHMFYTAPTAPEIKSIAPSQTLELSLDAAPLAAFRYAPDIEIRNGIPTSSDPKAPPPESLGKIADLLAPGPIRIKAFIVLTEKSPDGLEMKKPAIVATPAIALTLAPAPAIDFAKLDAPAIKALLEKIAAGFHADAVAGQNAHDRAVQVGPAALPTLLPLVDDKTLTAPGQMWLASTLIDLNDPATIAPLLKLLKKGGPAARVVAYDGPKLKNAQLTAAIEKTAATTKDADLIAWSIRGLGVNNEKIDPNLLETMVTHSDPVGRAQAADILAAHPDPQAIPLLAKLINDPDQSVRIRAIAAAYIHKKTDGPILAALQSATQSDDPGTAKLARQALDKLKKP